ncbi:DJ-1/PfpI family protein [Clostridium akagii]|uniref:DJ-1/PfpI family protein n=1 Tax=Clostridium akagii TaxID=91623 RepID=UPI00047EA244|nr:DJ-1/PfpI family protein [Clostridium akagii]
MGKILCFIYDNMVDFEMTLACHLIGKEIVPIAYEIKVIKSTSGMCYYPITTVKEAVEYKDVDGLNDEQRRELTELINKLNDQGKLLSAICAGPQYLARAGILKEKKYTTALTEDKLKEYFPMVQEDPFPRDTYVNENVVRDNNIITAVGNAFIDFSIEILDYFGKFNDEAEKKKCSNHYKTY